MRTKTESLTRTNLKNLSLRLSSDMAAKQAVLAVKVADLAQVGLVAEKVVLAQVGLVAEKADGVVPAARAVDGVVLVLPVVRAATDLEDLIPTHNHKPSA